MNEVEQQRGFFVKALDGTYSGPFADLKTARNEAKNNDPELLTYHGVLKKTAEDVDDSRLYLVRLAPKPKNEQI
jgi:hypothetical protein